MKVNPEKTYIVYLDAGISSKKIVVEGKNLEVENGNCRIMKGTYARMGYAVFVDVMKMYYDNTIWDWCYGDRDHDKQFPIKRYRLYKDGSLNMEVYLEYLKIEELLMPLHENSAAAEQDAAKERFPLIARKGDELIEKRKKELARPWYRRMFSKSCKSQLAFVEELIDTYQKNMKGEDQ